jgi:hypothetical protein
MRQVVKQRKESAMFPKMLRLVVKNPGQAPETNEYEVKHEKDVLPLVQSLVGGYVEQINLSRDVDILCDEDGISKGLPQNCGGVLGKFIFIGLGIEDWAGLTVEQAHKAVKWCHVHSTDLHPGEHSWKILSGPEAEQYRAELAAQRDAKQVEWDTL